MSITVDGGKVCIQVCCQLGVASVSFAPKRISIDLMSNALHWMQNKVVSRESRTSTLMVGFHHAGTEAVLELEYDDQQRMDHDDADVQDLTQREQNKLVASCHEQAS